MTDEFEAAEARDARGRLVVLEGERWRHIYEAHPELRAYRAELLRAVGEAKHVLPGRAAGEEWFYADGIGPSRWLKVVVAFASDGTGRIITAFARRRKP